MEKEANLSSYEIGTFETVIQEKYARASQKEIRKDLSAMGICLPPNIARCCMCELAGGTIQVKCAARVFQCAWSQPF